jgi:pimeloyl-ACP methyl ester carboxylesterase
VAGEVRQDLSSGYKLLDLADEVLSLVRALGIKQYVLVGHSMGGKVAQFAASRRPEGLSGLIRTSERFPTPVLAAIDVHEIVFSLACLSFIEPSADVADDVAIKPFVETSRYIADMGSGKEIFRAPR